MSENKQIFISYNWNDSQIVDVIDNYFLSIGLPLIRDKRELQYKSSIKEFMQKVRETDFVIMVISDTFLKSTNCMYEVLELVKEVDFKKKLLQVLLPSANIFSTQGKLHYINFWDNEYKLLEAQINSLNAVDGVSLIRELKHIDNIKGSIGEFLEFISDENCIPLEALVSNNYEQIINQIGFKQEKTNKRPKIIRADVFRILLESNNWIVVIGLNKGKPYEIYCRLEDDRYLNYDNIDITEVALIQDADDRGFIRIDLEYLEKNEPYYVTQRGFNRVFDSKELYLYTKILISLLQSDVSLRIIIDVLDEMYTEKFANPYVWKDEMKKILSTYINA